MKRNYLPIIGILFLFAVFFAAAGGLLSFNAPPLSDLPYVPPVPVVGAFKALF